VTGGEYLPTTKAIQDSTVAQRKKDEEPETQENPEKRFPAPKKEGKEKSGSGYLMITASSSRGGGLRRARKKVYRKD